MGPVSPDRTPSNAVFRGCWVVLAWAVGAGLSAEIGLRGSTSKRGMACVNGWTPNSGLRGNPVGMEESSAYALRTNGLNPFFNTIAPAAVNSPILNRSRRETCPCDPALRISARFLRAFSASLSRAFDALPGRYMRASPLSEILASARSERRESPRRNLGAVPASVLRVPHSRLGRFHRARHSLFVRTKPAGATLDERASLPTRRGPPAQPLCILDAVDYYCSSLAVGEHNQVNT